MKFVLTFVFIAIIVSCYSAYAGSPADRLSEISKNWPSDIEFTQVKNSEGNSKTGPCWFNEETNKVEYTEAALNLADPELTSCFARAFAQARYSEVEGEWKKFLGVKEAWVVRAGKPALVETPSANGSSLTNESGVRVLWASLATSELQKITEFGAPEKTGNREIASEATDNVVRKLLGY